MHPIYLMRILHTHAKSKQGMLILFIALLCRQALPEKGFTPNLWKGLQKSVVKFAYSPSMKRVKETISMVVPRALATSAVYSFTD